MTSRVVMLRTVIENNPGIHFRGLMRETGLMNGVLSYHLSKLEKDGRVKAVRSAGQARFYPPSVTDAEMVVIKALRRTTPKALLLALLHEDGVSFVHLVKNVKKSPSTVSMYLSQLIKDGLVEMRLCNLKKQYHLTARDLVDRLIEDYGPSIIGRQASGFEDIINSL